jgi:Tol biopolymer transport system component
MPKISISYRRADSEAMTGRIFDRLIAHYGKEAIFRDIDDIPVGIDFRVHINEVLRSTHILLAIIGPAWLGAIPGANERIQEESDPVRVEVETALRRRVPVIPVLIGNTRMPSSDQLPPSLKDFAFRNAVKVDTGQDFDYHMDRLIKAMDGILNQAPKPPPSRETKIPRQPTAEREAAAALADAPRRSDTGSRPAAQPAAGAESSSAGKPFSLTSTLPTDWRGQLWPDNRQARIMRLSIGGVVAAVLLIAAIFAFSGGSGGSGARLLTLSGHSGAVTTVAFAPGGRTLVSGSTDKSLKIWDAGSGQILKTMTGDSDTVSSVAYLPSGKRIISGSYDRSVVIWDADTGEAIRTLRSEQTYSWEVPPAVWAVAVSPDGTRIVSGSADSNIKVWSAATGELLRVLRAHNDAVTSIAYFPDGKLAVSGSKDGTVKLWDANTWQILQIFTNQGGAVFSVAVAPDGKRIAASGNGNSVTIWNVATGQQARTLVSESGMLDALQFSGDGKRLFAGGSNNTIVMWDAEGGQFLHTLSGHSGPVRALAVSPDGHRLASGSDDKTVGIWSAN